MGSDRFQRPHTAAGARAASATDAPELAPHPPDVRDDEVDAVLATEFPMALRGYDRTAVDAYVQRASRIIAELRAGSSPQSAVRYALEQVSEETRDILQKAHDTADATTSRAREDAAQQLANAERDGAAMLESAERYAADLRAAADEQVKSAERDAAAVRAAAERKAAELEAAAERDAAELRAAAERDAVDVRAAGELRAREAEDELAAIWQERERLIEDAREIAARLADIANAAAERQVPQSIALDDVDTESLPARDLWDDDIVGYDDDQPPPPALRPVPPPPPPEHAAPEPALADAPPPQGETVEFAPLAESEPPTPDEPPHRPDDVDDAVPDEHDKAPPHGDKLRPLVDDDETLERDS